MSRGIRKMEYVWAAIAAGLAGFMLWRRWRARRKAAALPEPKPGLPPYPHRIA